MDVIHQELPGVYIHSVKIGETLRDDTLAGFFVNSVRWECSGCALLPSVLMCRRRSQNEQIEMTCQALRNDPQLMSAPAVNVIGTPSVSRVMSLMFVGSSERVTRV